MLDGALRPLGERDVPVDGVVVPERLRGLDDDHAANLARSMDDIGLQHPITVQMIPDPRGGEPRFVLLAGLHRLHAARRLGWAKIRANAVACDEQAARLVEIDENLARREMSPWHRAVFLAERQTLYEVMYPETVHGKAGALARHGRSASGAVSFAEDAAEKLGLSARTIQRATRLYRHLTPEVRAWADQDAALQNDLPTLKALAKAPAETQRAAAAARDAGLLKRAKPDLDPIRQQFDELMRAWDRAGEPARARFLAFVSDAAGEDQEADDGE